MAETDFVNVEDHVRVNGAVVPGPHGEQVVIFSVDEDLRVNEEVKRVEADREVCAKNGSTLPVKDNTAQPPCHLLDLPLETHRDDPPKVNDSIKQ